MERYAEPKQQAKLLDPLVTLISIIQPDPEEPFFFLPPWQARN